MAILQVDRVTDNDGGYLSVPPGTIIVSTAATPSGFIWCNGAAVSRSVYSTLFGLIGTTFGAGDGSTTFNVPDLRNRFIVGSGLSYTLGTTGGSADAIVVSHSHTGSALTAGSHTHSLSRDSGNANVNSQSSRYALATNNSVGTDSTQSAGSHWHTLSINAQGSSGTNANLPPYISLRYSIKY